MKKLLLLPILFLSACQGASTSEFMEAFKSTTEDCNGIVEYTVIATSWNRGVTVSCTMDMTKNDKN